ncbi:MAG: 4a-hydroxytetrahydrobiopterin dehydratase [Actinomycetota bacterium]|jgi:4a-hydroxytetrahydrobiopterin dehydratase
MADVLTEKQIDKALAALPGWAFVDGKLHKDLRFRDFNEAFGFMARVALVAEKRDHHPDWSNSYNTVVIDIVNHGAGGVTKKCIDLAIDVEAISREMVDPAI